MALMSVVPTHLVMGLFAGTAAIAFMLSPATAQLTNADPLQDFQNQDNRDPFSGRSDGGQSFSVFDMIHRANLGNTRSVEQFSQEQQESLNDAAEEFRARQRERLQQAGEALPGATNNTLTTPTQGN